MSLKESSLFWETLELGPFLETRNLFDATRLSDVVLIDVERVGIPTLYATFLSGNQGRANRDDLSRMVLFPDDGGFLEDIRSDWSAPGQGCSSQVDLGRPCIVIYTGVDRRLFGVRLTTYDYSEATSVAREVPESSHAIDA